MTRDDLQNLTGKGVRIAVLDSGIDTTHPALDGLKLADDIAFERDGPFLKAVDTSGDVIGHGTAIAWIIRSLAPEAEIGSFRVLDGDLRGALEMARAQAAQYSKNAHLLRPVYDLERRNKLWNDALITLGKLQKANVIARDEAGQDKAVLWIILGDMAAAQNDNETAIKAYKHAHYAAPKFAPTVLRLSRLHLKLGQRYRAVSLAKRAIEKNFHPSFVALWDDLKPQDKNLRWFEWLANHAPTSAAALNSLAKSAIDLSLWGEAKSALMRAEKIEPTKDVYRLWVELEEKNNAPQHVVRQWLDRLETAPAAQGWVCKQTMRSFADYTPVVEPETLFNTVEWGAKQAAKSQETAHILLPSSTRLEDIMH